MFWPFSSYKKSMTIIPFTVTIRTKMKARVVLLVMLHVSLFVKVYSFLTFFTFYWNFTSVVPTAAGGISTSRYPQIAQFGMQFLARLHFSAEEL